MTFGLTPNGFNAERLDDIIQELNNNFVAEFGDINTSPQSVFGQIIGVMAKSYADLWENLNDVYLSQYPNSASGVSLDNVVQLNGITRFNETQTLVFASCTGNEGTPINAGALAQIPLTNDLFFAQIGGTISANNADFVTVLIDTTLTAQSYQVSMNGAPFIFALPVITFTGSFVAGNSTTVTINGITGTAVPFNTDSATTISDIAAQILVDFSTEVFSATVFGSTIHLFPILGFSITVNYLTITGAGAPTYSLSFDPPSSVAQISSYLVGVLNAGTPSWTAIDLFGSFTIQANTSQVPFKSALGTLLTFTSIASPIVFLAQNYGPIACPVNALTQIVTPLAGWISITNYQAGITGRNIETDAELRIRRLKSIRLLGLATVETIEAHLIQVAGVQESSVVVFENITLTEDDLIITFSANLVAGQQIDVSYNGGLTTFSVLFNTDMATTMSDLATAFLLEPQFATAVVSGGDLVLTLGMNIIQSVVMVTGDITTSGSGILPDAIVTGGRPPKSFESVVVGGTDADIAEAIWLSKPAGIETFGNTSAVIVDNNGNNQTVFFSRPTPIYIWVNVVLTLYSEETFPPNGLIDVANVLVNYGNSLSVGNDVLLQRVLSQIFDVPGIASGVMTTAATIDPSGSPSFGSADISISDTQISNWDLTRITVTI